MMNHLLTLFLLLSFQILAANLVVFEDDFSDASCGTLVASYNLRSYFQGQLCYNTPLGSVLLSCDSMGRIPMVESCIQGTPGAMTGEYFLTDVCMQTMFVLCCQPSTISYNMGVPACGDFRDSIPGEGDLK